jgi:Beta/Gamma crystallin
MHMNLKTLLGVTGIVIATQAAAQITFYEDEGFRGRYLTAEGTVWDLAQYGFNGRAESVVVSGGRWQACEQPRFQGHCVTLEPGNYDSLVRLGVNQQISSVRPADPVRIGYETPPPIVGAAPDVVVALPVDRRYQARVTSVRAVVGGPGQQCWVEKQQIGPLELPGAIVGGMVDLLSGRQSTQYIQHCQTIPSGAHPDYWDVTYEFQGIEHHVQTSAPPGPTIAVNGNGEPRG